MQSGINLLQTPRKDSGLSLLAPSQFSYSFESYKEAEPYLESISGAETKYGLPKNLLANVISTESRFDPKARSDAGAVGIAQIMPEFHPGVDPTDPEASIDYSARYLKKLYDRFGSWDKALAAYNTGPTNLRKYGMGKLPEETRDYLAKINVAKVGVDKAKSALDLIRPDIAPVPEAPLELPVEPKVKGAMLGSAEDFYGRSTAVSPPIQGLVPMVVTPEVTAYMGRKGFGPKPEGGWREDGVPLNKEGEPYFKPEKATGIIAETLQGISSLATHPLEVIRGGLDFALSIPGFLTGILSASTAIGKRRIDDFIQNFDPLRPIWDQTGDTTLEDLYNIASEEMHRSSEFFEPAKRAIVGEPTPESMLTVQTVMAPMTALSMAGHEIAGHEVFKDYPNVRGAAKFAGDILGLMAMGLLFHRGSRAGFTSDVEAVVKEAGEIAVEEQAVQGIPNEIIKQAQQMALDAKKAQLDLKAQKISEKFSEDVLIREELARQAEEIAKAKTYPVADTGIKKATKAEVRAVTEKLPEDVEAEATFTSKKGNKYFKVGEQWFDSERVPVTNNFIKKAAEKGKVKVGEELAAVGTGEVLAKEFGLRYIGEAEGLEYYGMNVPTKEGKVSETTIATKGVSREQLVKKIEHTEKIFGKVEPEKGLARPEKGADEYLEEDKAAFEAEISAVEEPEVITEVDEQTGADLPDFTGENSPFYQDKETTIAYMKIYNERGKSVETDPELFTQKLINDGNRFDHGDKRVDIDKTRRMMSMLAERADELRDEFLTGVDHLAWKETVGEAAKWLRELDVAGIDRLKIKQPESPEGGPELRAGISPEDIIKSARKISEYTKKARGMKAFKPKEAAKMTREEFTAAVVDKSGNIRKEFLARLGDEGYRIVQKMVLTKGASSLAAKNLKQMSKEVYGGKGRNLKKIQDDVILSERMIDIGKYKTEKQFRFPGDMKVEDFVRHRQAYRYKAVNGIRDLTDAEFQSVESGVKAYYDWMKKALDDLLDAELISQEDYDRLKVHNYRRIKLVDIYDTRYKSKVGKKPMTVYDSGVESLARGRETDIYEPSSEIMALEVFNRTYGRILNNKANQSLLDLAKRDKNNPFVRTKEHKGDHIPSGWNRIFVFEKGERKAIYLSPEMSKEWINSSPDISYRMGQLIRYVSGAPILRLFATGINWGFAVANLPRDVMHIWYAARVFEGGKWKPLYSSHAPIYGIQMTRDLMTVASDAILRKGRTDAYYEDGGGMEFLVHQGRIFQRGRHLKGPQDTVLDFMGYFGETTELAPRLAIRERVIRRRARERGISVKEARKIQEIRDEATFAARDYMDFGQGGWATKAADNGIPYLGAAVQGTRGMWRAFKDNPFKSSYKLAQFATAVSGLYIAMKKMHPKSTEALQGNVDMQNNLCIPLGDQFGFEDEMGQMRYPYLKMPLDPSQKFFKTFFEAATDKWLGNEVDIDRVVDSLKEQSPVGVTELPPAISGALGYVTNKDFWLNEDIWRKTDKPFGYPSSKEEFIPGYTPEFYEDFGAKTGLSPERSKYVVEELTTKGTVWSYLLGEGYKALFGDMPKEMNEQHLAMVLTEKPIIRRFFGVTHPYSQHAQPIEKAKEKSDIDRWIQNRGLDARVDGYLYHKNVKRKEIIDYMKSFKDMKVFDRLKERFVFQQKMKGLPNRSFWLRLRGLTTEARAKVYYHRLESLSREERQQMMSEVGTVIKAGGVITPEFRREVSKLRRGE